MPFEMRTSLARPAALALILGTAGCSSTCSSSTPRPAAETHALPACTTHPTFAPVAAPASAVPFAASVAATPAWIDGDTRVGLAAQTRAVPQPADPAQLFASLAPFQGDLDGALLVCQVTATAPVPAARFLRVSARIGALPEIVHQGLEGAATVTFALPGVTLHKNDRLSLAVATLDASCRIGPLAWWIPIALVRCDETTVRSETSAAPFLAASPIPLSPITPATHKAECRALDRPALDARLTDLLTRADAWFPELCTSLHFDADKRDLGWPSNIHSGAESATPAPPDPSTQPPPSSQPSPSSAQPAPSPSSAPSSSSSASAAAPSAQPAIDSAALHEIAALVGWADPRVAARLARAQAIHDDWVAALGPWVAAEARKLPASGTAPTKLLDAARLRFASGLDCDPRAVARYRVGDTPPAGLRACVLSLIIENTTAAPLDLTTSNSGGLAGLSLRKGLVFRQADLLFANGQTSGTSVAAVIAGGESQAQGAEVMIAPGASVTVELAAGLTDAQVALQAPVVLRLFHDDARLTERAILMRVR